jgi:Flp pilus assembly pilin Flp
MTRMRSATNFLRDRRGVSTVEFAFIMPVLLLVLAGVVDLGGALKAKFDLNSSVSAASNFALINSESVSAEAGADLAAKIAAIAKGGLSGDIGSVEVVVNSGPKVVVTDGGTQTLSGGGDADACYCPTRSGSTITFGGSEECGTACPSGGTAGKFVVIRATKPHSPLFGGFGVVEAGNVTVQAVVQPK